MRATSRSAPPEGVGEADLDKAIAQHSGTVAVAESARAAKVVLAVGATGVAAGWAARPVEAAGAVAEVVAAAGATGAGATGSGFGIIYMTAKAAMMSTAPMMVFFL